MEIKKHLDLLGYEVEDKVSNFKGVVISISFDLYGCVQADVRPKELTKKPIFKSEDYLNYIRSIGCIACDRLAPSTAHHETFGAKAIGKNLIPDSQAMPLCHNCHIERRHRSGYRTFWKAVNLDPKLIIINLLTDYLQCHAAQSSNIEGQNSK